MIKKINTLLLALALIFCNLGVFAETNDIWTNASNWALVELNPAKDAGLIPEALFKTDFSADITRTEFAALSVTLYEKLTEKTLMETKNIPFSDTDDINVSKAYNAGFTTGISETEFGVNEKLTRQQASTMISRVYKKYKDENWKVSEDYSFELTSQAKFADDDEISDWAKNSVYFMNENEIIKGTGNNAFSPSFNMSREAAVIVSYRIFTKYTQNVEEENTEEKTEDTNNDENGKEEFKIAFIGGSLTEGGGASWIKATKDYLQEKMPEKKVTTVNAGIGGTMSDYGMLRYQSQVLDHEPDMVFIEFSSNDANMSHSEAFQKIGFESMLRQSVNAKKQPYVILLHAPRPVEKETERYINWKKGVDWKNQIANAYGIKIINVYDYMYDVAYQEAKKETPELTFFDFLGKYYSKSGEEYDVHGGYKFYGEAIIKAFTEDYEGMFKIPKKRAVVYTAGTSDITAKYTRLPINHSRMNYTKGWEIYSSQNKYIAKNGGSSHPANRYWVFPDGVRTVVAPSTDVQTGFMSKAKAFCVSYFGSTVGLKADVLIDEVKVGTITNQTQYGAMNYITDWIELPNDGKEHRVVIKVLPASEGHFSFGCIYEKN